MSRLVIAIAIVAAVGDARAQSAAAEALFRDGRALVKQGRLADGCGKLAASERLESSVGTLLNLGDCREQLGKLATAWAAFRKAEAMARVAGDAKRSVEAARRAALVEPKLVRLAIEAPHRVDGLAIRRDGDALDPAALDAALPIDPGSYTIVAEAPGYKPWRITVVIDGSVPRTAVTIPPLERVPVVYVEHSPPPQAPPVQPIVVEARSTWTATRGLSALMIVGGMATVGTGIYFGVQAQHLRDDADRLCPTSICADPRALHDNDQAQTDAKRANVLYVAGGAALAAAVVLWIAGAPTDVTPAIAPHQIGVSLQGSF